MNYCLEAILNIQHFFPPKHSRKINWSQWQASVGHGKGVERTCENDFKLFTNTPRSEPNPKSQRKKAFHLPQIALSNLLWPRLPFHAHSVPSSAESISSTPIPIFSHHHSRAGIVRVIIFMKICEFKTLAMNIVWRGNT